MEKESFREKLKESIPYALAVLIVVLLFGWVFNIIDESHMNDKYKKITKALIVIIPIILYFIWTTYNMIQMIFIYNNFYNKNIYYFYLLLN